MHAGDAGRDDAAAALRPRAALTDHSHQRHGHPTHGVPLKYDSQDHTQG